ncbi:MAG: hypothetical protein IJQ44_03550 [Bacteroidaceae bacterium]|nr:hypothetical protein [Bacteroidaceae bacterium]
MEFAIIDNNKCAINGFDKWPAPKASKQWKCGRSAMELAKFVLNRADFSSLINSVLCDCGFEPMYFDCYPEYKTSLGKGMCKGGPRVHDMLMIGEKMVIGIEAKVSESFDEKIKKIKEPGKIERSEKLAHVLSDNNSANYKDIGYQLFTATYGTMKAAIDAGKDVCIALFIVFKGNVCKESNYDDKCRENDKDFNRFCEFINVQDGYIIRNILGKRIKCWIKKIEVEIGTDYSFT